MARIVTGALTTLRLDLHIDPQTLDLYGVRELWSTPAYGAFGAYTGSGVKFTLDANFQLGFRVAPSAWGAAQTAMDIGTGALRSDSNAVEISHNTFFDGTNWKAKATGVGTRAQLTAGVWTFTIAPSVTAGSTQTYADAFTATVNGFGYPTGSGGTVTQATSKSTGVTLNKTSGSIVMNNASLGAGAVVAFTLTNSCIAATDTVVINMQNSIINPVNYRVWCCPQTGAASIVLENRSGGALGEVVTLNFAIIKAVTS